MSPFGIGRAAFTESMRARKKTAAEVDSAPSRTACLVPDFDIRKTLGRKGTRSMDRVTGLAVTAVGALLDDDQRNRAVGTGEGAALTLGTTTGSVQSQMDFTRDSLTCERPYFVDPARFPNAVMNCAAGQCAIWYQLKGPNTTIAGGHAAGLHALKYARQLLNAGRAKTVLCGAAEEYSHARAWLERQSDDGASASPLGEGCAVMLVEPAGAGGQEQPVLAEIRAVELGICLDGDWRSALGSCLRRALHRAGVDPADVAAVARSGAPGAAGEAEAAAVNDVLAPVSPVDLAPAELIGDTGAAAAAFQAAALLVYAEDHPAQAAGRIGVITSVDRSGSVGCALLGLC